MNQLEQTPKEYKQKVEKIVKEASIMFGLCITFILVIAFLCCYIFVQKETNQKLYGKIKQDSISIQSYKNLLLTPKNQ